MPDRDTLTTLSSSAQRAAGRRYPLTYALPWLLAISLGMWWLLLYGVERVVW